MGSPQASGKKAQGGAGAASPGPNSAACKAFKAAAKAYCADEGKRNGKFNDYYFRALNDPKTGNPGLAKNMKREVPFLQDWKSGDVKSLADFQGQNMGGALGKKLDNLAVQEEKLRKAAEKGTMSWDSYRNSMNGAMSKEGLMAKYRYPDAMLGDQAVEIKGPGDTYGDTQLDAYEKINPNKPVLEISCESCKAPCADGNSC